ncbi:MAG: hypothetical protein K8T20_09730 [Planctomycetes bacterium]|nr:hypothetical protein [Planctomycetota bacterium]
MKNILAAIAAAAFLGGCAFMTPKPPPESAPPPAEGPPLDGTPDVDQVPEADSKPADVALPDLKKPLQEIPGWWVSKIASGPDSQSVRRVELVFQANGAFSGTILREAAGKKYFALLEGTWRLEEGHLAVILSDGRARTWLFSWAEGMLILRDGEAELQLERMPE